MAFKLKRLSKLFSHTLVLCRSDSLIIFFLFSLVLAFMYVDVSKCICVFV
jgi:uncharacterized membrane protein YagU involved in acid resistance